jgi:hypothetical protein
MGTRETRVLAARLEGVQRRFEHWRRTRKVPSRIPGPLWAAAVKAAGTCGVSHTAKTLGVNYNALKQHVDEGAATTGGPTKNAADQGRPSVDGARSVPAFLELAPPTRVGSCQCTLELEDASGAKMRVHLQGAETPDLAALSRSFWDHGP